MSKLQDALNKIQKAGRGREVERGTDPRRSTVVARLSQPAQDSEVITESERVLHVDQAALRDAGFIAPEHDEFLIANQYRDIKRPLIDHAVGKRATRVENGKFIMVASAVAGEGKTFTSINLALSMAQERDYSVLLVDADVAKPEVSETFGASGQPGLLDALEDPGADIRTMILGTDVDGLSVLPAGNPRSNATELLASSTMESILETLGSSQSNQLVIFDSPPLLQTSEAKVLAGLAGQIVLVVRAESTARSAVMAAVSMLDDDKAVNLILNQARAGTSSYQYAYSYRHSNPTPQRTYSSDIFESPAGGGQ